MPRSIAIIALAVAPVLMGAQRAAAQSHVVRHDMASATSDEKQCAIRQRGNPSTTGSANRADPTTKGNKDCAAPVVYGHTQVQGTLFYDLDHDGVYGADEVPLAGWTVQVIGPMNVSVVTDGNGAYTISGLTPGTYTVCVMALVGWSQTFPAAGSGPTCSNGTVGVSIDAPAVVGDVGYSGVDFGFFSN